VAQRFSAATTDPWKSGASAPRQIPKMKYHYLDDLKSLGGMKSWKKKLFSESRFLRGRKQVEFFH
jgi:hypothetical protein